MRIWRVIQLVTTVAANCRDATLDSCNACIARGPECHWCKAPPTLEDLKVNRVRCGTWKELQDDQCSDIFERPKSTATSEQITASPLQPRTATFTASYGSVIKHELSFLRPEVFNVDMFYLMDLSKSMKGDLENLKNFSKKLMNEMMELTQNSTKLGMGSFVDRPLPPFTFVGPNYENNPCYDPDDPSIKCDKTYTYRTDVEFTSNSTRFETQLAKVEHSSNYDRPEDGLTAMTQAITCKSGEGGAGWAEDSFKLLIFATDAAFHVAGDGLLGGLIANNDGQCHMEGRGAKARYSQEANMDYPSVGRVLETIKEKEISVILAVTEDKTILYENFKEAINTVGKAEMGVLASDSDNLVDLVVNEYIKLSEHITLKSENIPDNIKVDITPNCGLGKADGNDCDGIKANQKVTFDVEITIPKGLDLESCRNLQKNLTEAIEFKIYGMSGKNGAQLRIDLECECSCDDDDIPELEITDSTLASKFGASTFSCQNGGVYSCGVCSCAEGYSGALCECETAEIDTATCLDPRNPNQEELCNGRGYCDCQGECICNSESGREIRGQYCEFDSKNCPQGENGLVCSGNGECQDNYSCKCNEGWTGTACECSKSQDQCMGDGDDKICNGNGVCQCNKCKCENFGMKGFYSETDNCKVMTTACNLHAECAMCIYEFIHGYYNSTAVSERCRNACSEDIYQDISHTGVFLKNIEKHQAEEIPDMHHMCTTQWSDTAPKGYRLCKLNFGARSSLSNRQNGDKKSINLIVEEYAECPEPVNLLVVFGSIFGSLLLLGILALLLIVLITRHLQAKEVKQHYKDAEQLTFSNQNPIYQPGVTEHSARTPLTSTTH